MLIELDKLEGREAHDLLAGAIVPRAIAWVSTVNEQGEGNLAPFSFFTGARGGRQRSRSRSSTATMGPRRIRSAISARRASSSSTPFRSSRAS